MESQLKDFMPLWHECKDFVSYLKYGPSTSLTVKASETLVKSLYWNKSGSNLNMELANPNWAPINELLV